MHIAIIVNHCFELPRIRAVRTAPPLAQHDGALHQRERRTDATAYTSAERDPRVGGNLVDQEALRESLDKGHISRASLDVVEPEPLPAGHWIYRHPRVLLSPHISWSGPNMVERLLAPFFANVVAFSNDQPLQGVVDTAAGY